MIFSELYSVYYHTVAKVLAALIESGADERAVRRIIAENAFGESAMTILPAIREGRWQIIRPDLTTPIRHAPTLPLTLLQKQWLKAVLDDPRVRLFDIKLDGLDDVEPLFTQADYCVYDRYGDGDPYDDLDYIRNFRLILDAIKTGRPIRAVIRSGRGYQIKLRCFPKRLEYSEKDDKFRMIATGGKFRQFNVGRIVRCEYDTGDARWLRETKKDSLREVTLSIRNERNALERVMMHFAHFEKQAERMSDETHRVRVKYYSDDETELIIRVLSFGPLVKVLAPDAFAEQIKERLTQQKTCGLR